MIKAQHEDVLEARIKSTISNIGLSSQAKYFQDQLQPISNGLNTLQSDNSNIADACHIWLTPVADSLKNLGGGKIELTRASF